MPCPFLQFDDGLICPDFPPNLKEMNILFVGDIVGKGGRRVVQSNLGNIREQHGIQLTVANVENAAGGFGITPRLVKDLLRCGVDVMTSGNHIWDKPDILETLDSDPRLLRPANYPPGVPGNGSWVGESSDGTRVAVINLQGRVFMPSIDCPFRKVEDALEKLPPEVRVILIDFHAEATSEKMALGLFLDGKVSAVVGTHTHVPTADCKILPGGTAYVTDVGMTGSYHSVIGMKAEAALSRLLTGIPARFEPSIENPQIAAVVIQVDDGTGRARNIFRTDWTSLDC